MADIDCIRRQLCSEKSAVRRKGRSLCESLFIRNNTCSPKCVGLVGAVLDYEKLEIKYGLQKNKIDFDNAVFVRRTISHCISICDLLKEQTIPIFEHIMQVLYDISLPPMYKNEHKLLLCKMIKPKLLHSLPFENSYSFGVNNLFHFLRDEMVDTKSIFNPLNLRLLTLLCKYHLLHSSGDHSSIKYLMQWFNKLLIMTSDVVDDNTSFLICVCTCYCSFMKSYGANVCNFLFESIELPLKLVIKQLSIVRGNQRYTLHKFLKMLFNVSTVELMGGNVSLLRSKALKTHIGELCSVICGDESFRLILTSCVTFHDFYLSKNKQTYDLTDPQIGLCLEVMALTIYHQHMFCTQRSTLNTTCDEIYSNLDNKRQKTVHEWCLTPMIDVLFEKISGGCVINLPISNVSKGEHRFTSCLTSQNEVNLMNLNCLLLISVSIFRLFPKLDFLVLPTKLLCSDKYVNTHQKNSSMLCLWIKMIFRKLRDYLCLNNVIDQNHICCFLFTLLELVNVSKKMKKRTSKVQEVWSAVFVFLIECKHLKSMLNSNASEKSNELYLSLLVWLLKYDFVESCVAVKCSDALLRLAIVGFPHCLNGPVVFEVIELVSCFRGQSALTIFASHLEIIKNNVIQQNAHLLSLVSTTELPLQSACNEMSWNVFYPLFCFQFYTLWLFCVILNTCDGESPNWTHKAFYTKTHIFLLRCLCLPVAEQYVEFESYNLCNPLHWLSLPQTETTCEDGDLFEHSDCALDVKNIFAVVNMLNCVKNFLMELEENTKVFHSAVPFQQVNISLLCGYSALLQYISGNCTESALLFLELNNIVISSFFELLHCILKRVCRQVHHNLLPFKVLANLLCDLCFVLQSAPQFTFDNNIVSEQNNCCELLHSISHVVQKRSCFVQFDKVNSAEFDHSGSQNIDHDPTFRCTDTDLLGDTVLDCVTDRFLLNLTDDTLVCFVKVTICIFFVGANTTKSANMPNRQEIKNTNDLLAILPELVVQSEVYLVLADQLSSCVVTESSLLVIKDLICNCSWDLDWGVLGYCKVLRIICNVSRQSEFWNYQNNSESFLLIYGLFVAMMFPISEEESLVKNGCGLFQTKMLLISGASYILRFCENISNQKQIIIGLFVDSMADQDIRVRLWTALHIPHLLRRFKNMHKVYSALILATDLPIFFPQLSHLSDCDPSIVVTTADMITRMGCYFLNISSYDDHMSKMALIRRAFVDLVILCSSRNKLSIDGQIDYQVLLFNMVEKLAASIGYIVKDFTLDYMGCLLYHWTKEYKTTLIGVNHNERLDLKYFPFQLLFDDNCKTDFFIRTQDRCASFCCHCYGFIVVPVLVCIADHRARWKYLLEYSEICQLKLSDNDLAQLVLDHICWIKAREFSMLCITAADFNAVGGDTNDNTVDALSVLTPLQSFLARNIKPVDFNQAVNANPSEIVLAVLMMNNYQPYLESEEKFVSTISALQREEKITSFLSVVSQLANFSDIGKLMTSINTLEILATLNARLLQSKLVSVFNSIVTGCKIIAKHSIIEKKCWFELLNIFKTSVKRFPLEILHAIDMLVSSATLLFNDITIWSNDSLTFFIPVLICEITMLSFIQSKIARHNVKIQLSSLENFTVCYFTTLLTAINPQVDVANALLLGFLDTLAVFLQNNNLLHIVKMCFPLPSFLLNEFANYNIPNILKINLQSKHLSLSERMKQFTVFARKHMTGGMVGLLFLWSQLSILHDNLSILHGNEIVSPSIVSLFASCLLKLSQYVELDVKIVACSGSKKSCPKILQDLIVAVLGQLAARDTQSLNHNSDFPGKFCDVLKDTNYNMQSIKLFLFMKVYGIMWINPSDFAMVSNTIRRMSGIDLFVFDLLSHLENDKDASNAFCATELRSLLVGYSDSKSKCIVYDLNNHSFEMSQVDALQGDVWSTSDKEYNNWVSNLSYFLIECFYNCKTHQCGPVQNYSNQFIVSCKDICLLNAEIAEVLFPLIIHDILVVNENKNNIHQLISDNMERYMFDETCSIKQVSQLGCKALTFLFRQIVSESTVHSHDFNIKVAIDFKKVIASATRSHFLCTALFFAEIMNEKRRELQSPHSSKELVQHAMNVKNLLIPIFKSISDSDAMYGVDLSGSLNFQAVLFEHEGSWMEALNIYESIMQTAENVESKDKDIVNLGIARSLKGLGAHHLLNVFCSGLTESTKDTIKVNDIYSLNLLCDDASSADKNISVVIPAILLDLARNDVSMAFFRINSAWPFLTADLLQNMFDEVSNFILPNIFHAQQLAELSHICGLLQCWHDGVRRCSKETRTEDMVEFWKLRPCWKQYSCPLVQSHQSLRFTMLTILLKSGKISVHQALDGLEDVTSAPSKSFASTVSPLVYRFWSSVNDHIISEKLPRAMSIVYMSHWYLYECKLMWRKGLTELALEVLNNKVIAVLRNALDSHCDDLRKLRNLLSEALRVGGEWMSHRRAATGIEILVEYLNPAAELAEGVKEKIEAYDTLGNFNERLYQNVKSKVTSDEWKQSARVLSDRIKEFELCRNLQQSERQKRNIKDNLELDIKSLYKHTSMLKREIELDSKERAIVKDSEEKYLAAAITFYGNILQLSDKSNMDTVFRLINLWLTNCHLKNVNELLFTIFCKVPSYKFVPLSYQIFSRMVNLIFDPHDKNDVEFFQSTFSFVLFSVVCKLCSDHPHHTLHQLFSLLHGQDISAPVIVNAVVTELQMANIGGLFGSLKILLASYVDLANINTELFCKSGKTKNIKFKEIQSRGKRFNECLFDSHEKPAVVTITTPLNVCQDYMDIIRTIDFLTEFSLTDNGLSRPKIVTCVASDGHHYKQLVKGGDDMRQDAVMEQVFDTVNHMLGKDDETLKRKLLIRTYKIIPTTPQTGVLQWVENTTAFGAIVCDKHVGTHNRYYLPSEHGFEWSHIKCRDFMKDATDNNDKLSRFHEVLAHFQPSFRFFFLERFADPTLWLSCRLSFVRSVAVTSIVGYILGIGDRHAHNILVDTSTGEVIHIDFGIIYEQGKGLGTPETVPFRLTRDMVDGMGITECEGTFRRSCEEVLRVLKLNIQQIMTILEVVLHDPLYKWSLSPLQARLKQNTLPGFKFSTGDCTTETVGVRNLFQKDAAERTLLRIKHKLQGYEDLTGEALGIKGLVDLLISEARSSVNLSKLFPGWAAWI